MKIPVVIVCRLYRNPNTSFGRTWMDGAKCKTIVYQGMNESSRILFRSGIKLSLLEFDVLVAYSWF